MMIFKTILWLTILLLVLLDIALICVICYFLGNRKLVINLEVTEDESEKYFNIAKEIIRKEGTD